MIERILKNSDVNPKVELTESYYNRLVSMAQMNAKKIEERAREIYEQEGVATIRFIGNVTTKTYGEVEHNRYEFTCDCKEYTISPTGEYEKTLYFIPQESREKIAKHVKRYVEKVFEGRFGEHLTNLNEIERLKHKYKSERKKFMIWTILGWLTALTTLAMSIAISIT